MNLVMNPKVHVSQGKVQDWQKCPSICLYMCTCPTICTERQRSSFFLKTATLEYQYNSEEQQTADKFPALQERTVLVTGIDTQGSRIKGSRAETMETLDDRRE